MMKVIALVYRKPGVSAEEFRRCWLETHAPLMLRVVPGLLHYTQNVRTKSSGFPDDPDGISEMWFEDSDSVKDYLDWRQSPEARDLRVDEDCFQDSSRTRRYFVEEQVIKKAQQTTGLPG